MAKSKKKHKINPRRQPRTQADIDRAAKEAMNDAVQTQVALACLAVKDVFDPSEEQFRAFVEKYHIHAKAISDGDTKYLDYIQAMEDDYGLTLTFV